MNLFGLEGSGFVIALGLMLLLSGTIMFYCLRRFAVLENSVCEQGKILQNVLINLQNSNICVSQGNNNDGLATNDTIRAARDLNKIEVSDDDSDSCYSDYSSESYESSEENNNPVKVENLKKINDIKVIDMEEGKLETFNITDISNSMALSQSSASSSDSQSVSDSDSEIDLEINNSLEDSTNILKIEENKNEGNIKKLKVADLRELVMKKGLMEIEEINKLKKDNLIKLLQSN